MAVWIWDWCCKSNLDYLCSLAR